MGYDPEKTFQLKTYKIFKENPHYESHSFKT